MSGHPQLYHVVLDSPEPRALAEFYRTLLGLKYRDGDEPPAEGQADDADWLVLVDGDGKRQMGFQLVDRLERTTWPSHEVPMQLHVDFTVPDVAELLRHSQIAQSLGAEVIQDRADDPEEPIIVFADPSGHPFCIFVV